MWLGYWLHTGILMEAFPRPSFLLTYFVLVASVTHPKPPPLISVDSCPSIYMSMHIFLRQSSTETSIPRLFRITYSFAWDFLPHYFVDVLVLFDSFLRSVVFSLSFSSSLILQFSLLGAVQKGNWTAESSTFGVWRYSEQIICFSFFIIN